MSCQVLEKNPDKFGKSFQPKVQVPLYPLDQTHEQSSKNVYSKYSHEVPEKFNMRLVSEQSQCCINL